jgi:hypothetical protein
MRFDFPCICCVLLALELVLGKIDRYGHFPDLYERADKIVL